MLRVTKLTDYATLVLTVMASQPGAVHSAAGGYRLARAPEAITLIEIVEAMEGPLAVTECSLHGGQCGRETHCGVRANWRRINDVVLEALRGVSLAQMLPSRPANPRRIALKLTNEVA